MGEKKKQIAILGSTGSIGTQALKVIEEHPDLYEVYCLTANNRVELLAEQAMKFKPAAVVIANEAHYDRLCSLLSLEPDIKVYCGAEAIDGIVEAEPIDMVLTAMVGFAGLSPTIHAIRAHKTICLANKETLVVAGELICRLAQEYRTPILPVDSEHSAIFQCIVGEGDNEIEKILLTASGGPFRTFSHERLATVTKADALQHPTWNMGAKITIDSATMMNKGFEVLEAKVLFDFPLEKTKIILHDESHVHSLLRLKDGTLLADVSEPDMHGPIAYALYESNVNFSLEHVGSLEELRPYHFHPFDAERYPAPGIALRAFEKGGTSRAVLNGANEAAVYAFLAHRIPFLSIEKLVKQAVDVLPCTAHPTYLEMQEADKASRAFVEQQIGG